MTKKTAFAHSGPRRPAGGFSWQGRILKNKASQEQGISRTRHLKNKASQEQGISRTRHLKNNARVLRFLKQATS